MRPARQLLRALLVPVCLLLGVSGEAGAQEHDHAVAAADTDAHAMRTMRWSDPAAWPGGKVPGEGDAVTIARDMEVVLDVDPPALRSLTDRRQAQLRRRPRYRAGDRVDLPARRRAADRQRGQALYARKATITLTDKVPGENINTMGDRGIMLMGGTLSLHGDREHTWTKLAKTAERGSSRIEVLDASGWRQGDEIVLASTDFNPRQAERRTIAAISGNTLTLDRAARVHALRRDHLRRRRARRSRPADPQHPHPGFGRRRDDPTSAGTSWRWRARRCRSRASSCRAWAST